jgi:hypothetical protein
LWRKDRYVVLWRLPVLLFLLQLVQASGLIPRFSSGLSIAPANMGKKTNVPTRPAVAAKPRKTTKAKPVAVASKPAAPRKSVATPSKAADATPSKKAAPAKSRRAKGARFPESEVALRAYFIAEKRQNAGLPGNPHLDWIEAERQLAAESRKPKLAAAKKQTVHRAKRATANSDAS